MIRLIRSPARAVVALALLLPCPALADPATPPAAPAPSPPSVSLPDDLPVYARAVPISSMTSPASGTIVTLRSEDDPAAILEWYDGEFAKRGWRIERRSESAGRNLLTALKGARKASLLITSKANAESADRNEAQIMLVVTEER